VTAVASSLARAAGWLACAGEPAFGSLREGHDSTIPLRAAILSCLPLLTACLQHRFHFLRGLRNTTHPFDPCFIQLPHIRLAVDPTISHIHTWLCIGLAQLRLDRGNGRKQTDLVTAIAVSRLQEQGYITIVSRGQGDHPLLEIFSMVARIAMGNRDDGCLTGVAFCFRLVFLVSQSVLTAH
jgi:hypothetical protein